MLTVYGIETFNRSNTSVACNEVATVLTVYGIETFQTHVSIAPANSTVATVLTVYGIETSSACSYKHF